ncbi:MAG: hypothetical protein AB1921_04915 [Thermodesulfobacteriota bacterium]
MAPKKFSIAALVAAATISFIISGIGGALLSEWLARPKPLVTVSALGFTGADKQVATSDALRNITNDSKWFKEYRKFESFEKLAKDYKKTEELKLNLERALTLIDDWLKSNEHICQGENQLTLKELDAVPFMQEEIICSSLFGMALRGEFENVPVQISVLKNCNLVTELAKDKFRYILYMREKNIVFPFDAAKTKTEVGFMENLAYSFAAGNGKNIVYYMQKASEASNREIRLLTGLLGELEKSMNPATALSVRAEVFNSGRKPLVVKPYALLRVVNDDVERRDYLLRLTTLLSAESVNFSNKYQEDGGDVVVEGFLPTLEDRSYVLVPPNDSIRLQLASDEALGEAGSKLRAIYNANVLRAKLILVTDAGEQIASDPTIFGASANADVQRELLGAE